MKKVFGYVLVAVSATLLLLGIGTISNLLTALYGLVALLSGDLDGYGSGQAVGMLSFWGIYIFTMIKLWNIGRRWIRKVPAPAIHSNPTAEEPAKP